jgi:hypothetical protein
MSTHPLLRPSDRAALLGVVSPQSATTAKSTAWFPLSLYENFLAAIKVGAIATGGTVNAKLEQATDSSGTGAKDVTGKSITQLTEAGSDSNKQALINASVQDFDIGNGFCFGRLTITPATAAALIDGEVWGFDAKYETDHAATVDEVV